MLGILTFIFIFGVIVTIHEYGHFYFAKKAGILVREFAIGMGPKIFAHRGQDGTLYTIRLLPLGGYVRMAGWGDDKTEIKTGSPASLTLNQAGKVTRINLSQKQLDVNSLPMSVLSYDLEDKLQITGLVLDETKTFTVDHDATIVEVDGTELRIAPKDVQYQNATVAGKLMTNFAGPMNNFILGTVLFMVLVFLQGGVADYSTNKMEINSQGALAAAGVKTGDQILAVGDYQVTNWEDLIKAMDQTTANLTEGQAIPVRVKSGQTEKTLDVVPQKVSDTYVIGVSPGLKRGLWDKIFGGLKSSVLAAVRIVDALRNLILRPNLDSLGGPVAMYQISNQVANQGLNRVIELMAFLSINIGIFNLVPIPVLDGGKIVINLLEGIRRKPLKQETESYLTLAGVVFMILLMLAVTWNDIMRTFFNQ
ncbi:RIP metalloprotease RseP [Streptococcus sp. sy004]|uniref:RIP metalloprotease RseP n=1 Tax=Streptococcus sp. sy004 TaxID=2600149 RepID=UPI0011B530CD|nr:RIP metalloprotease RseP [Streptococcus sp. sy004]TWT11013.1 RIP metalloprotease RseP [Streptococcus sp. sy004]